jgi:hypothetical protein
MLREKCSFKKRQKRKTVKVASTFARNPTLLWVSGKSKFVFPVLIAGLLRTPFCCGFPSQTYAAACLIRWSKVLTQICKQVKFEGLNPLHNSSFADLVRNYRDKNYVSLYDQVNFISQDSL